MTLFIYIFLFVLLLCSIRVNKAEVFLDKNTTKSLKGVFIITIVLLHILQTFPSNTYFDRYVDFFISVLGQLQVSFFFLVSGFGIALSVSNNGKVYAKSIFSNRVFRIIIYSFFSLIAYFIYDAVMKKEHFVGDYFLSIVGLASFGNESWFLFAILICYCVSGLVFFFNYKRKIISCLIITICIIGYILISFFFGLPRYYYNSIISFPLGVIIGFYYPFFISFLKKNNVINILLIIVSFSFIVIIRFAEFDKFFFEIPYLLSLLLKNVFFSVCIVTLTWYIRIKSKILMLIGSSSFAIFIMHRFVINCFVDFGIIPIEWLNYITITISSVFVGIPYYHVYKILDKYIINPIVVFNRVHIN